MSTTANATTQTEIPEEVPFTLETDSTILKWSVPTIWHIRPAYDYYLSLFYKYYQPRIEAGTPLDVVDVRRFAHNMATMAVFQDRLRFEGQPVAKIVAAGVPVAVACLLAGEDFLQRQATGTVPQWGDEDFPEKYQDFGKPLMREACDLIIDELNMITRNVLFESGYDLETVITKAGTTRKKTGTTKKTVKVGKGK